MLLSISLIFCQFQSGVAYKSVAYKKSVPSIFENVENTPNHLLINYSSNNYYLQTFLSVMCVHGTTLKVLLKLINVNLGVLLVLEAKMVPRYQICRFSANGNC